MRSVLLPLITVLLACGVLHAQDGPTPYPDSKDSALWPGQGPVRAFDWMHDNRASFWKKRAQDRGAVVFVGDSITGGWKLPAMRAAFPALKVANRGIGGDVSRGLLFRFKEDVLDLDPRAVVVCIGTNDLSAHAKPEVIAGNIGLLLDQARDRNPSLPVVLCTIPPRASPKAPLRKPQALAELNALIVQLAQGRDNVVVFDLFAALAAPDGSPEPGYFRTDLIHPSPAGHQRWGELLAPVLASLDQGPDVAANK